MWRARSACKGPTAWFKFCFEKCSVQLNYIIPSPVTPAGGQPYNPCGFVTDIYIIYLFKSNILNYGHYLGSASTQVSVSAKYLNFASPFFLS